MIKTKKKVPITKIVVLVKYWLINFPNRKSKSNSFVSIKYIRSASIGEAMNSPKNGAT